MALIFVAFASEGEAPPLFLRSVEGLVRLLRSKPPHEYFSLRAAYGVDPKILWSIACRTIINTDAVLVVADYFPEIRLGALVAHTICQYRKPVIVVSDANKGNDFLERDFAGLGKQVGNTMLGLATYRTGHIEDVANQILPVFLRRIGIRFGSQVNLREFFKPL
jgi:hypothetical protein